MIGVWYFYHTFPNRGVAEYHRKVWSVNKNFHIILWLYFYMLVQHLAHYRKTLFLLLYRYNLSAMPIYQLQNPTIHRDLVIDDRNYFLNQFSNRQECLKIKIETPYSQDVGLSVSLDLETNDWNKIGQFINELNN